MTKNFEIFHEKIDDFLNVRNHSGDVPEPSEHQKHDLGASGTTQKILEI